MSSILILLFLSLANANIDFCGGSFNEGCVESERQALLMFKEDLIDHANRLANWSELYEGCCGWVGVICDNVTGHVTELHLRNPDAFATPAEYEAIEISKLRGKLNPSLLKLKHLNYLDLSKNAFEGIPIPKFLGSIEGLRYLNLSSAGFGGLVPQELGNLSSLQHLDLHADDYEYNLFVANDLQWLSGLSSLEYLDLGSVNLGKASNWFQVLNTLPSLKEFYLSDCQLPQAIPSTTNLNLSSLAVLDLSANAFENPLVDFRWIFHLNSLVHLDLSENELEGCIFDGLENMTSLRYLDLSFNFFNSSIPNWLYNLTSLQFLNLGSNNLKGEISSAIGNMTSAVSLDFSENELEGAIPRSMGNLCNLESILLSGANLSQDVFEILEIFSSCVSKQLVSLDLSRSQVYGQLTYQLRNFKKLKQLYLSANSISGPIPFFIGELSPLRVLKLDHNKLTGHLLEYFGQLANLEILDLSNNLLEEVVAEIHFANLTKLKFLDVSRNSFILKVSPDWLPPFQLQTLGLRSVHVGWQFPQWLGSQKYLVYLDISNSMISDSIPSWFWNSAIQFQYFNLSHNHIHGQIPNIPRISSVGSIIDLSFNNFSGPLPRISSNLSFLDLSNNLLSGSLSNLLCFNNTNETMGLEALNLGGNSISGKIPDCWMKWQQLMALRLDSNNLNGRIPSSLGSLHSLLSLQLQKNNLFGEIPFSLKNCTNLVLLDFRDNELHGSIPKWLGHSLSKLQILSLRSNRFSGSIPDQLCAVSSLQILDLSDNNLVGSLPRCIGSFTAMVKKGGFKVPDTDTSFISYSGAYFALLMIKGQMLEYSTNLNLVRSIDLSHNSLSGEIPMEVTNLFELQSLNLSHNLLTGTIPETIGVMRSLESLDFSVNKLSGSIPQSMLNLTFLNHLNLSCNNLTGEIPSSTQLQSFDPSSYVGNQLCGLPLPNKCSANDKIHNTVNGSGIEMDWFFLGMAFGFVFGFWSVFGPWLIDGRWRSTTYTPSPNVENH